MTSCSKHFMMNDVTVTRWLFKQKATGFLGTAVMVDALKGVGDHRLTQTEVDGDTVWPQSFQKVDSFEGKSHFRKF